MVCGEEIGPSEVNVPKSKKKIRPVAILDMETDPFKYGRVPFPFVIGIIDPENNFHYFWGDDCIQLFIAWLQARHSQEWIIYAHNGGKFDYMYLLPYISGNMRVINGRIVSAKLCGHEIRDSYSIMPFPLRDYKKDDIDYAKLERAVREKHKEEIVGYLKGDCVYLRELVHTFHEEFGQKKLTIGSTAMGQIKERHPFERTTLAFDRVFRPDFFYGGRVECFMSGVIDAPVTIVDINSAYPAAMRDIEHPTGLDYIVGREITNDTCYVVTEGRSAGAFPIRTKSGLRFTHGPGIFSVTRHEFDAAISTGTYIQERLIKSFDFPLRATFANFVTHFYDARKTSKKLGDDIRALLYKFTLNSGYGKFAQNPANFYDWTLASLAGRPTGKCPHCHGRGVCRGCFKCQALNEYLPVPDGACMFCNGDGERWHLHEFDANNPDGPMFWKGRTFVQSYYNVATGASITGAVRATLLRGLALSDGPVYCDTDSIITTGKFRGPISHTELGHWKPEGRGVLSAIAGKKLYAIFDDRKPDLTEEDARKYPWMLAPVKYKGKKFWCIKKAHKGMKLSPEQILKIAMGWEIEVANDAPTFGLYKEPTFITRVARPTS